MRPLEGGARVLRGLAVAVGIKVAVVGYLALSGTDYALRQYVLGAAFAPRFDGQPDMMLMMACLLPQLAFVYIFCDYVPSGLLNQATSVMPRLSTRASWAARKTRGLVLVAAAYVLAGNLAGAAILAVVGGGLPAEALAVVGYSLLLELLIAALLALVSNAVALLVDPVVAAAVVSGAHGGTLVFQAFQPLSGALVAAPWLPSVRSVLAWHDVPGIALGAPGLTLGSSCALLAGLALLAAFVLVRIVSCADIV